MFRKQHPPPGSAPGALALHEDAPAPRIDVIQYNSKVVNEIQIRDLSELPPRQEGTILWVSVQGLGDETVLRGVAERFSLHPLVLADIVNVPQRPKLESYEGYDLLITRSVCLIEEMELRTEQLSIVIGKDYLLTFEERQSDLLEPVRVRIRQSAPLNRLGADYLAYSVLDTAVDGYYPLLESIGEYLEELEDKVVENASANTLRKIHDVRRMLMTIRRSAWPQRDALSSLLRGESPFIGDAVQLYMRDCHDHAGQIIDVLETYREMSASLMEVYLSSLSNRMNEVMKMLTIMASIFIPLSFLASVYGMNFQYQPELSWRWGYPALWLVMLGIAGGMLAYFRRRGWIGSRGEAKRESGELP